MESYKNLKKGTKVGLTISFILVVLGIASSVYSFFDDFGSKSIGIQLHICVVLIEYLLVADYTLWAYKKPHGNMLRYALASFAFLCMYKFVMPSKPVVSNIEYLANTCNVVAALLIAYISGRLHKIKENKMLLILVGLFFAVNIVLMCLTQNLFHIDSFIRSLSMPICWAAYCFAYTARYEEHKAAGLEDAN